jgi:hypothetical protein
MLTSTRRRLAAGAMVLLVPVLGACGFSEQTDQVYQPAVGTDNRSGNVDILGAVVVSSLNGEGTFVASLVNNNQDKDDTLVTMTGDGLDVSLTAPIKVPAGDLVNLADTGAVSVTGDTVQPGKFARLTLTFESGQKTEVNVPVVPYSGDFNDVRLATPKSTPAP